MRNTKAGRTLDAPRSSVWAVLADYPNIDEWNVGVLNSFAIGDATEGVGAARQTELMPKGAMRMRETVTEWVALERMVIDVDQIKKQPVKRATMTMTLSGGGEATQFEMSYDYEARGGPLAFILGPMLDRQMGKAFEGFMDNLEVTAQAQSKA